MTVAWLLCLVVSWVTIGCGLGNRKVYLEAEEHCGQTHFLDSGEVIVIGSKRVPSSDLREQCEITFSSASADDQDRVCMEIEELSFQGNRFASLSVYDVMVGGGRRVKKLGVYDTRRPPPREVCSLGTTLRMELNRGFISFQRDLVLFLLQVYTKNPDAPVEDRVTEVPGMFRHVDTYIVVLIVIAAVVVLAIIAMVAVVVFCVRQKSARNARSPGASSSPGPLPGAIVPSAPRQELKSGQEYFPLRPIPQRHYINQRYAPYVYQAYRDQAYRDQAYQDQCRDQYRGDDGVSPSVTGSGTQSTPVSSYYQTYALHDHAQPCSCYSYPADSLQGDTYPNDGYASERYSGENYERFSGEGYHSDSYVTERYPLPQTCNVAQFPPQGVLRGYAGYPGITHPLVPGMHSGSNVVSRQGEEDADQSDVSDNEGQGQERVQGQMATPSRDLGQNQGLDEGRCRGGEQPYRGEDNFNKVATSAKEEMNDDEYQEIGPSQFRHVTFM